ncbi:N-acetylneuraminate synthase family protein [bacterium]|nr:N-acetylneuraminate synthase family protein [bacterium]
MGDGHSIFIIAESGVNHNGAIDLEKLLIWEAKEWGADSMKFQTFETEWVATRNAPNRKYELKTTDPGEVHL